MLKKLQEALTQEARICLQRLNGSKDPTDIAVKFATYRQTIVALRIVSNTFYPKDKESREACHVFNERMIEDMETDVIVSDSESDL
jgi:hypothetical protein